MHCEDRIRRRCRRQPRRHHRAVRRKAAKVFALEPHPGNFAFLPDQIRIRDLGNVEPPKLAASKEAGRATIQERESQGIHSLGPHNTGWVRARSDVEVTTLDHLWREWINDRIGLLKAKADVFDGTAHLLNNRLIDAVVFKFSPAIHRMRALPPTRRCACSGSTATGSSRPTAGRQARSTATCRGLAT